MGYSLVNTDYNFNVVQPTTASCLFFVLLLFRMKNDLICLNLHALLLTTDFPVLHLTCSEYIKSKSCLHESFVFLELTSDLHLQSYITQHQQHNTSIMCIYKHNSDRLLSGCALSIYEIATLVLYISLYILIRIKFLRCFIGLLRELVSYFCLFFSMFYTYDRVCNLVLMNNSYNFLIRSCDWSLAKSGGPFGNNYTSQYVIFLA